MLVSCICSHDSGQQLTIRYSKLASKDIMRHSPARSTCHGYLDDYPDFETDLVAYST